MNELIEFLSTVLMRARVKKLWKCPSIPVSCWNEVRWALALPRKACLTPRGDPRSNQRAFANICSIFILTES